MEPQSQPNAAAPDTLSPDALILELLRQGGQQNTPSLAKREYEIDLKILGDPTDEDKVLVESLVKNAEALDALQNFDPTEQFFETIRQMRDEKSPIGEMLTNLGIKLDDPTIENLRATTDKLNQEIVSYINDLQKKRDKLVRTSPYRNITNLMMALMAAAPESADRIVPMLMFLAPQIKENQIQELDETIMKVGSAQADIALRATQVGSLAENRKLNIVKFFGDTAIKLTRMDLDKLRGIADKWLQRYRGRLSGLQLRLKEKQQDDKTYLSILRNYYAYENMIMRQIARITPVDPQSLRARYILLDRLAKMSDETRTVLKGTPYEKLVLRYDVGEMQRIAASQSPMDYLLVARRQNIEASTRFLGTAALENLRSIVTQEVNTTAGVMRMLLPNQMGDISDRLNTMLANPFQNAWLDINTLVTAVNDASLLMDGFHQLGSLALEGSRLSPNSPPDTNAAIKYANQIQNIAIGTYGPLFIKTMTTLRNQINDPTFQEYIARGRYTAAFQLLKNYQMQGRIPPNAVEFVRQAEGILDGFARSMEVGEQVEQLLRNSNNSSARTYLTRLNAARNWRQGNTIDWQRTGEVIWLLQSGANSFSHVHRNVQGLRQSLSAPQAPQPQQGPSSTGTGP